MRGAALACALLATASAARAETPLVSAVSGGPVTLEVRVAPQEPVIGDPITLELTARAEPGVELLMPAFGEALDRFGVVAFVPSEELDAEGRVVSRQRYTLQASRSGAQTIPPLLVEFVDHRDGRPPAPEGADAYELLSERIDFPVKSVLPSDAKLELRPPRGPLGPRPVPGQRWWPLALAALVGIGAASPFVVRALAARRAASRRQSAYEIARAELDSLLHGPPPDAAGMDAFFVKLSAVVRIYLEDRFGLRSPELTTEEFLEELVRSPDLYASHREVLRAFLQRADLVKFAGHVPDSAAVQESVEAASRFLEETREAARA